MIDPYVRPLVNPPLQTMARYLAAGGFSSNALTFMGFLVGLGAMFSISQSFYKTGALLFCLNRLLDGLDGPLSQHTQSTDFGGILDITCDFIIYAGMVFAFGVSNPENLFPASFLIFSFIGPITTFLAYAIIAAKRQVNTTKRGIKSFYHLGGICEGTETAIALLVMCLFPEAFTWTCVIYGILCWLTTIGRLYQAYFDFDTPLPILEPLVQDRE